MDETFQIWKHSLRELLDYYEHNRGSIKNFFPKLFVFFIVVNVLCYWFAMTTAYPELLKGAKGAYYFKVQFPVGILGALFDSLSFFVTIVIIRRALVSQKKYRVCRPSFFRFRHRGDCHILGIVCLFLLRMDYQSLRSFTPNACHPKRGLQPNARLRSSQSHR